MMRGKCHWESGSKSSEDRNFSVLFQCVEIEIVVEYQVAMFPACVALQFTAVAGFLHGILEGFGSGKGRHGVSRAMKNQRGGNLSLHLMHGREFLPAITDFRVAIPCLGSVDHGIQQHQGTGSTVIVGLILPA